MNLKAIAICCGIFFTLLFIIVGSILCWQSTLVNTCSDWEAESKYYGLYQCDYTDYNNDAVSHCNTSKCFCEQTLNHEFVCFNNTPPGLSKGYLIAGIMLIVFGVIAIILTIISGFHC